MRYKELIVDIINMSKDHPTAEQIFLKAKSDSPKISLATVYNNINALCKEGRIKRISVEDGGYRYDNVIPHAHLLCVKCGKVDDILIEDLSSYVVKRINKEIIDCDLKISYLCDMCKEESK